MKKLNKLWSGISERTRVLTTIVISLALIVLSVSNFGRIESYEGTILLAIVLFVLSVSSLTVLIFFSYSGIERKSATIIISIYLALFPLIRDSQSSIWIFICLSILYIIVIVRLVKLDENEVWGGKCGRYFLIFFSTAVGALGCLIMTHYFNY